MLGYSLESSITVDVIFFIGFLIAVIKKRFLEYALSLRNVD